MTELAQNEHQTAEGAHDEAFARARRASRMGVEVLEGQIAKLKELIEASTEYDVKLVSHLAWLTSQLVPIQNEWRQQQKATIREVSKIPIDSVVAYLKTLSMQRREAIAAEIVDADAGEPLL
jgi:hypothetical protein